MQQGTARNTAASGQAAIEVPANHIEAEANCASSEFSANLLHVWVDADSCPKPVRQLLFRAVNRLNAKSGCNLLKAEHRYFVPFHFVAAQTLDMHTDSSKELHYHQVAAGPDSADQFILEHCHNNDIIITRDIVFAEQLCLQLSQLRIINDRGTEYTAENVSVRRLQRDLTLELRSNNLLPSSLHTSTYSSKDLKQFADCFDRCLSQQVQSCLHSTRKMSTEDPVKL